MAKKSVKKTVNLKLLEPFEYAGETVSDLTLKRPSANDISELGTEPKLGDLIKIGLKCAAMPPSPTMSLLCAQDGIQLANAVSDFLAVGPQTGGANKS